MNGIQQVFVLIVGNLNVKFGLIHNYLKLNNYNLLIMINRICNECIFCIDLQTLIIYF